ncbi:alkaline phosphatase PhoX [Endozoicomonas sp. OPT23]|uniref:alkaline phosphatase PhoX n=1 Tax=Endozoicomonas sp. OPT23 TaxID=2072845 RepID=UPI001891A2F2|nr:alkaline phosphatase PhoX [Endozoicomonas sp. OPT23]
MAINRRQLLQSSSSFLALGALGSLTGCRTGNFFKPLRQDTNNILDLPEGFTYKVLQTCNDRMSDGYMVPGSPDGMASFLDDKGNIVLMRNHELDQWNSKNSPTLTTTTKELLYDPASYGCVSRLVIRPDNLKVLSSNLVLAGTTRNCAGGPSPWGWISCEESTDKGHGYAFLCDYRASKLSPPKKLTNLGRFYREAFAFDPRTGISYMTEDRDDSCFYRYLPADRSTPFGFGQLQAMAISEQPKFSTSRNIRANTNYSIHWVDIDEPNSMDDTCRLQGQQKGAALIHRGEGLWFHNGVIYFSATEGGQLEKGQIFQLTDLNKPTNQLKLVHESGRLSSIAFPDNIAVAPWGDLVISEDGRKTDYISLINNKGQVFNLARNRLSHSEITGVNFSPDGRILFLNLQEDGLTIAITGPFQMLTS